MMKRLDASRSIDGPLNGPLRDLLGISPNPAWRPYLMGNVAATPDCAVRARELINDGADIVNVVGVGESQVAQAVAAIAQLPGVVVSADASRAAIAQAAIAEGARIINDVNAAADSAIASVAADGNTALVLSGNSEAPEPMPSEHVILDSGPSFSSAPADAIAAMRRLTDVAALGYPVLLALDRMDFLDELAQNDPLEQAAGSLAALSVGIDAGVSIVRTHDIAGASDYLTVRAALNGQLKIDAGLMLAENKRRVDEGSST